MLYFWKWLKELFSALAHDFNPSNFQSVRTLLALKTTIAVTLAILISWGFHIENPYWAGISAIVVLQASSGATIERAMLRVLATIVAVLWALFLVIFFHELPILLFLAGFLTLTFSFYYGHKTNKLYAWVLGPGTFLTVLFFYPPHLVDFTDISHLAALRTLEVLIGTGCALVCALIYPVNATPSLKANAGEMLNSLSHLHTLCLDRYIEAKTGADFDTRLNHLSALVDSHVSLRLFAQRESLFAKRRDAEYSQAVEQYIQTASEIIAETYQGFNREYAEIRTLFAEATEQLKQAIARSVADLNQFIAGQIPLSQVLESLKSREAAVQALEQSFQDARDAGTLFNFSVEASIQWQQFIILERNLCQLLENFCDPHYILPKQKRWIWQKDSLLNPFTFDRYYWLYAIKGAVCAIGFPLIAVYYHVPGAAMLGIWVLLVMQMDGFASKRLGFLHVCAFVLASLAAILFVSLQLPVFMFIPLFMLFIFLTAYIFHGPADYSYMGVIAGVMFIAWVVTNPGYAQSWHTILEILWTTILSTIFLGIFTSWIWPFTDKQKMAHGEFQIMHYRNLIQKE